MTVAEVLEQAQARGLDRLDAQLLIGHALGRSRSWLLAHGEDSLDAATFDGCWALIARRAAGEPVAYLLGEKEFHGLVLQVDARVLVPRPETELLVDWALELLGGELAGAGRPAVVDLGTGSGAIALAVKHAHPVADVVAVDVSTAALDVAQANARRLDLALHFQRGAWWEPLAGRRFDLVLSNPPYIAGGDPHLEALQHEPDMALTPGATGLEALAVIVASAPSHLKPGAWLLLEHGFDQAAAVAELLANHGLSRIQTRLDLAGQPRCTGARL